MRSCSALAAVGSALVFTVGCASAARAADDTSAAAPTPVAPAGPAAPASLAGPAAPAAPVTLPAPTPVLPPTGSAVSLTEDGDMVLACNGTLHRVELHGLGQLTVGDRAMGTDGTPGVILTTTSEELLGYDPTLGVVTISEVAPAAGELVSPVAGQTFPAAQSIAQDVTVSMEHSPCDDSGTPMTFRSKTPFPLLNTKLMSFPPQNSVFMIQEPVELTSVNAAPPVTAQLLQFPMTVTHHG